MTKRYGDAVRVLGFLAALVIGTVLLFMCCRPGGR